METMVKSIIVNFQSYQATPLAKSKKLTTLHKRIDNNGKWCSLDVIELNQGETSCGIHVLMF
jgi:hypothetical protein